MSQINHVENPIINSPFEAPSFHWHLEKGRQPEKRDSRRLASYFFRVPERAARGRRAANQPKLFTEDLLGEEYPLDIANMIRERLGEWTARGCEGVSKVSRELIEHWQDGERAQRLFFAQLEAAKAVIFLNEATPDLLHGLQVPTDEPGTARKGTGPGLGHRDQTPARPDAAIGQPGHAKPGFSLTGTKCPRRTPARP